MCVFSNFHTQQSLLMTPETWIIHFFLSFMHIFLFISSDNWENIKIKNVTQPSVRKVPHIALTDDKVHHIKLAILWLMLYFDPFS